LKAIIIIVILAAAGYWGYRHGYLKPAWFGLGQQGGSTSPSGTLEDTLNRGLPRMVSTEISLERAKANNLAVSYEYRFIDLDQYAVTQRYGQTLPADMRSTLIQDLCTNRALREQVLAAGRDVRLQVRAQDGRTMFTTELRPGGC
jgi:hypothetical protein